MSRYLSRQDCPLSPNSEEEGSAGPFSPGLCLRVPAPRAAQSQASGEGACDVGLSRPQSGAGRGADLRSRFGALLGCSSHLHTPQRLPGLRIPRGSSSCGLTQQSPAQRRVTREPSGASGLGARKLCPDSAQVTLGSEGVFPPWPQFPARVSPTLGHSPPLPSTQTFPDLSIPFRTLPPSPARFRDLAH